MSQSSQIRNSIIGIIALFALAIGVWFGIDHAERGQQEQLLEQAKQLVDEQAILNSDALSDVVFLLGTQLEDTNGRSFLVEEVLEEITLVNFWATWCAPCREEMPIFNQVYLDFQSQGFGIVGLTIDQLESSKAFVDELDIQYPILMAEQEGWDLLSKTGNTKNLMPYSLLIDRKGTILEKKLGTLHREEIVAWIEKYL